LKQRVSVMKENRISQIVQQCVQEAKRRKKSMLFQSVSHQKLSEPLIFIPFGDLSTPPTRSKSSAFLTSSWPKISGAMLQASFS